MKRGGDARTVPSPTGSGWDRKSAPQTSSDLRSTSQSAEVRRQGALEERMGFNLG